MTQNSNLIQRLRESDITTLSAVVSLNAKEGTDVVTIVLNELEHLESHAIMKPDILLCLPKTVGIAVRWVLKSNLSLDPNAGLVYVTTRNMNIGTREQPVWQKVLEVQATADGLISIARQCGTILDIKRPEVEYDETTGRVKAVTVAIQTPSFNERREPVAVWEHRCFDESDFCRWQIRSHKQNSRGKQDANANTMNYANENYTNFKDGIDPEFARAKAIRHGLKKLGTNQNESRAIRVAIAPSKVRYSNPAMDAIVMEEERIPNDEIIQEDSRSRYEAVETIPEKQEEIIQATTKEQL